MSQQVAAAAVVNPAAPPIYGPAVAARRAPLTVDESGRLIVTAAPGAPVIISGSTTPGDAVANPTACVDTRDFPEMWDPIAGSWRRQNATAKAAGSSNLYALDVNATLRGYSQALGDLPLGAEQAGLAFNGTNMMAAFVAEVAPRTQALTTDAGSRLVTPAPPSAAGANAGTLRASRARLEALMYSFTDVANCFFCLVNKASNPVNGDVPLWVRPATAGLTLTAGMVTVGHEVFGSSGLHFQLGIAWALSTTANVITLTAVPGATFVQGMYS